MCSARKGSLASDGHLLISIEVPKAVVGFWHCAVGLGDLLSCTMKSKPKKEAICGGYVEVAKPRYITIMIMIEFGNVRPVTVAPHFS